jgi:REP element-mobilizing transposase RayT
MARPLRLEHPGAVWHITSRGNNRCNIYLGNDDHLMFLSIFAEAVRRFRWIVHAYTLMTNHFHLILETPEPTLSRGMKWMNGKYAQWFNRKHDRSGHLFQGRFKGFLVEKETHLLALIRYVALNPVRADMVDRPEKYQWSSYRATAGYETAPPWLTTDWTLATFGRDLATQQSVYRQFVDEGAGITRSPFEDAVGKLFLGSVSWVEKMQALVESQPRSREHPAAQRFAGRPSVATIVEVVAAVCQKPEEEIRRGHGGIERKIVSWLSCYEGMRRLCGIAEALGLRSTSRVSAMITECDRDRETDISLCTTVDRCLDLLRHRQGPARAADQPASSPSLSSPY